MAGGGGRRRKKLNPNIADADEVLEHLTSVLRGEEDEDERITPRDKLRAAELLAKKYGALEGSEPIADVPRIINDIPKNAKKDVHDD